MSNLERIKRQLVKPVPISFISADGVTDTFDFKPLTIEQQAIMNELSHKIESHEKQTVDGIEVPKISKDDAVEMFNLYVDICKNSMPDVPEEVLMEFVNAHFGTLSENMEKLVPKRDEAYVIEKIKKRKEMMQNAQ